MRLIIKTLLSTSIFALISLSTNAKPSDFEIIKERVVSELMKSSIDDGRVKTIIDKLTLLDIQMH
ncbi:MAG: hypothetical protein KAS71_14005 [Bacteroidales bacterium]|nr:hypothetical protein [Bacteroidales bacterium]